MGLHITKDRDNLKEEVIEINEQTYNSTTDFGFYYYDLQQKNFIDQRALDELIDYKNRLEAINDIIS